MKIDLCKLLGVEEGEKFKFDGRKLIYFIQNGYLCYIGDYGEQKSYLNINNVAGENIIKLPKKKKFSQDTLNFFKCIDKKYKWITKDKDGDVCVYCEKPTKGSDYWLSNRNLYISKAFNQDMFDQILWEDDEPVYIDDYVNKESEED